MSKEKQFEQYHEYIRVCDQITSLEHKKKIMSENLLKMMQTEKVGRVETKLGVVTRASRKFWKFSDSFNKQVTDLKAKAKESGQAEQVESHYLTIKLR